MKVLLMTDMEGVAGVKNSEDWCMPDSRFYSVGCRLLTLEVNAAVEGFFAGGATYVQVADGHGWGGIDIEMLDPRVEYARGWGAKAWPFGLDESFSGVAWVGQHAKASTEYAHLAHTQSFAYIDLSINGLSIGEFGQLGMCAAELGVPAFFGSGDLAFTKEAEALAPGIVTCAVKRGVMPGTGEECTVDEYRKRNAGAVHTTPVRARAMIRKAAEAALWKLKKNPPPPVACKAPFERVAVLRPEKTGEPRRTARETHPTSVIELMSMPVNWK
ncbi:MAG TPA: M55 family metallopeptidase [Candidatus Hydrogenedentes bacterium]|nr:M55 family metallopeptidase [Candidatus Hydrogenedentota bacterium]HPC16571.1 M55 family metallopeptidase [Candidatus Hydrogenedentota bacterium]HRT18930.1 M55 family metallopeptidase [Candidatus Hydrogenedentota bacterium]HRT64958.1 M55 family metallopeptidase [Candidatus Hydrogenedentota bacterium]